jgi:outer membrane protein TolC
MKKILSILVLTFAIGATAQEVKTLSLKDAVTYALENKADAKKARLKVEKGEYEIQEIRSRAMPQITANGSLNYNPILQTTVIDGDNLAHQEQQFKRHLVKNGTRAPGFL